MDRAKAWLCAMVCRAVGHRWTATHANRWMIPTREVCDCCGTAREWHGGIDGRWVRADAADTTAGDAEPEARG